MYVIGTAGHVDHGKSALVRALTGIDPDRLQEEKDRGLTIDLGFAWLTLPGGEEVSIIDVPGHERFIKNMLAGVGGIDLALLVIAADEGVMPQTREHLAILDLLEVGHGVVALTKSDLVDSDWLDLVSAEVTELLAPTSLGAAPVVACSAVTGNGLEELVSTLETALSATPAPRDIGRPRLAIDRAFTIAGFGTVVTGTLLDGSLAVGQDVEILPAGARARIRGLQNHKQRVQRAEPGRRTAVNLGGVAVADLERGMQLNLPGQANLSSTADVRLRVIAGASLKHGARCIVHHFAAEAECRVGLLEGEKLAGAEGWAQLRLARPLPLLPGDHFVVRAGGETVGGGTVVEIGVKRHRRGDTNVVNRLEAIYSGGTSPALMALERLQPCTLERLARELPDASIEQMVAALKQGRAVPYGAHYVTSERHEETLGLVTRRLQSYQSAHPLRLGMPGEDLRRQLGASSEFFGALLDHFVAAGIVQRHGSVVALAGWTPRPSQQQRQDLEAFQAALRANPFSPSPPALEAELAVYAEALGVAVRIGDVFLGRDAYEAMVAGVIEAAREHPITLAEVRDKFSTSRRYAQALLEHLDQIRVTRRVGDARVLREAPRRSQGTEAS
ncbi:MAG: selenocysteine-specific translation elongation factor [Dehalococcoidia bacterium]